MKLELPVLAKWPALSRSDPAHWTRRGRRFLGGYLYAVGSCFSSNQSTQTNEVGMLLALIRLTGNFIAQTICRQVEMTHRGSWGILCGGFARTGVAGLAPLRGSVHPITPS